MAHARLRGSESAKPGTLLQELVWVTVMVMKVMTEEGDIYVAFAARQALCWALTPWKWGLSLLPGPQRRERDL